MNIKSIELTPNDDWLAARVRLEPKGTLIVMVRRDSGFVWKVRKSRGEASLIFKVTPDERVYEQDELQTLAQDLARREFLGVSSGRLLFSGGVEAQPTARLVPRDLGDNSRDEVLFCTDVPVPGVSSKHKAT